MLLFWNVRYLDTHDKEFKDRKLWLDTEQLFPATKAEVELCLSTCRSSDLHRMLRYRHFFKERHVTHAELEQRLSTGGEMESFCVENYFEDENGRQLSLNDIARIRTGSPNVIAVPPGAGPHDINFMLAAKRDVRIESVFWTNEQITLLGYFSRDFRELSESAFMKDGPGTLRGKSTGQPSLETAVTDDEIRSFVTIFRRLYMKNERFNFRKAAKLVSDTLDSYPIGKWIQGAVEKYEQKLDGRPDLIPFLESHSPVFSRKHLIDVYLYTRYAHQPSEDRERQYRECLAAVGSQREVLTWLFLTAIWECTVAMMESGRVIVGYFSRYCEHHGVTPDILDSILRDNPGVGAAEKQEARTERLLGEKAEELAKAMWESKGRPDGGYLQFVDEARERLRKSLE